MRDKDEEPKTKTSKVNLENNNNTRFNSGAVSSEEQRSEIRRPGFNPQVWVGSGIGEWGSEKHQVSERLAKALVEGSGLAAGGGGMFCLACMSRKRCLCRPTLTRQSIISKSTTTLTRLYRSGFCGCGEL